LPLPATSTLNNLRVLQYLGRACGVDEPKRDEWYRHWIADGFAAIEPRLAARSGGRYALGDTPTLADIFIVPQVANAARLNVPMEPYPRIRAVNEACLAHAAFDRAGPAVQPDAE
jgi:maleylpyruvate isomerase